MRHFLALTLALTACATNGNQFDDHDAETITETGAADQRIFGTDGHAADSGAQCQPPDMLVVLDHTDSMSQTPTGVKPPDTDAGAAQTKWVLACNAVTTITAAPYDQSLRFGLELFPLDPHVVTDAGATGHCETLSGLLSGLGSTNSACTPAELLVKPDVGTGTQIATILDPYTLKLCVTTPIAGALQTAQQALSQIAVAGRQQFIVLLTDGGETCVADSAVVAATQALATAGVETYVVGFGPGDAGSSGVNVPLLNDLACAGMTATGFPGSCVKSGGGYAAATPKGPPIFFLAENDADLQTALSTIVKGTCCGCVPH